MADLKLAVSTKNVKKASWVQTEREVHEAWAELIGKSPKAAQLMHILTARMGDNNALVISLPVLAKIMKCSRPTAIRAIQVLTLLQPARAQALLEALESPGTL